jgi:hypothetical protein
MRDDAQADAGSINPLFEPENAAGQAWAGQQDSVLRESVDGETLFGSHLELGMPPVGAQYASC